MKNNCTIVIPEHNRPLHLKRLLDYYLKYNFIIIVTDSSDKEFFYLNEYKDKIEYRHYPRAPLAEKINAIIDIITTPYVFMCANDDFIVPETVNKIISFLEINLGYNSGQGIYIDFDPFEKELEPSLRYENLLNENFNENDSIERLNHLMSSYFQFYYAVFRTAVFSKIYSSTICNYKTVINNLCLLEIYVSCYAIIEGKHYIISELYGVRENIFKSAGAITDNMYNVINSKKYKIEYGYFVKLISETLCKKESFSEKIGVDIIRGSVNIYMKNNFSRKSKIKYLILKVCGKKNVLTIRGFIASYIKGREIKPIPPSVGGMNYWIEIKKHINHYLFIYN